MIHYLLLDLDDTILDFHAGERKALSRTLTELGIPPREEILSLYHTINDSLWKALERGETTREVLIYERFTRLFATLGIAASEREAQAYYGVYLGEEYEFLPGAPELLAALSGEYTLYLVSNGNEAVQKSRLRLSGIEPYFRQIFISGQIGFPKPDPRFFKAVFARAPEIVQKETAIIGDSLTSDMQGGKNAGIITIHFNRKGKENTTDIKPDYEVRTLDEIPPLLRRI